MNPRRLVYVPQWSYYLNYIVNTKFCIQTVNASHSKERACSYESSLGQTAINLIPSSFMQFFWIGRVNWNRVDEFMSPNLKYF